MIFSLWMAGRPLGKLYCTSATVKVKYKKYSLQMIYQETRLETGVCHCVL